MKQNIAWLVSVAFFFFVCPAFSADRVVVVPLNKGSDLPQANTFTNFIGMKFNYIPAGTFQMGSPVTEPDHDSSETLHQVTLSKGFYMSVTEVTSAQWNNIITSKLRGVNPSEPASHKSGRFPVSQVSWFDALAFANWLSHDEGRIPCYNGQGTCSGTIGSNYTCNAEQVIIVAGCTGYRIPTEAEWEYAARASTSTVFANPEYYDDTIEEMGDGFNANLHAMGWYEYNNYMDNENNDPAYAWDTKPVGMKQANAWGLYDMHGNVREWTFDWYESFTASPVTDPTGPATGTYKVSRGGHHASHATICRSARRTVYYPYQTQDGPGIRLILPRR